MFLFMKWYGDRDEFLKMTVGFDRIPFLFTPPHVNSSLRNGLDSRRDVMRRGVSALCATWRSNVI